MEGSDKLVSKALAIAQHFQAPFFMENPLGLLKKRQVVQGIPMHIVDYCCYGYPYRKRTCIWTNTDWRPSKALCNPTTCHACENGKHTRVAQRGPCGNRQGNKLQQLYSIPPELVHDIYEHMQAREQVSEQASEQAS